MTFNNLRVTKDGDAFCITLSDFVNLQSSPAMFFDSVSWQGKILAEWWEATPLLHLPLFELISIYDVLVKRKDIYATHH